MYTINIWHGGIISETIGLYHKEYNAINFAENSLGLNRSNQNGYTIGFMTIKD